jgi:uncharacterized protein (TIGR02271 family)
MDDPKVENTVVVPVLSEELQAGVRRVPTGGVRVHKHIERHEEVIDQPLRREHVEVRRVVRNQVVPGPLPVRHEGDTTIVPVVKEILKIEKQFILTEELHISKRTVEERHAETVLLRQEQAEVERIDAAGNPTGPAPVIGGPRAVETSSEVSETSRKPILGPIRKAPVRRNKVLPNE